MRSIGFCDRWIGLIMVCVRMATYSILINGEPKGLITPSSCRDGKVNSCHKWVGKCSSKQLYKLFRLWQLGALNCLWDCVMK